MGFEPCFSALERPTIAVRSETIAVRSFTSSVKSVMGITSRRMEGAARHMELPSTTAILSKYCYKYEYMFDNNSDVILSKCGFTQGCRKAAMCDFMSARVPILTAM